MNILINASNLNRGGGLQVAHSFILEIRNNTEHSFNIVLSKTLRSQIEIKDFPNNFKFFVFTIKPSLINIITGKNNFLKNLENKIDPDIVFSVFSPTYWRPKSWHISGYAKPQYIYKKSPFFNNLSFKEKIKLKIKEHFHLSNINKCCDELITETHDVSGKLKEILPLKKIHTVTNYYHQIYDNEELWDKTIILPAFNGLTILTISANYPHKNLNIIKKVILYLNKNYPEFKFRFILTIDSSELNIENIEINNHIVFLGKVDVLQCPNLYQQANFMFLPTLLECFSASYPEAMIMKKPILTSNISFAKGLCGTAAKYFNPESPKDISESIIKLSKNKNEQKRLVENGIQQLKSYDNSKDRADKYLKIIKNL
jgi:glycosyltransferase involved in cell wall biosynthesis